MLPLTARGLKVNSLQLHFTDRKSGNKSKPEMKCDADHSIGLLHAVGKILRAKREVPHICTFPFVNAQKQEASPDCSVPPPLQFDVENVVASAQVAA